MPVPAGDVSLLAGQRTLGVASDEGLPRGVICVVLLHGVNNLRAGTPRSSRPSGLLRIQGWKKAPEKARARWQQPSRSAGSGVHPYAGSLRMHSFRTGAGADLIVGEVFDDPACLFRRPRFFRNEWAPPHVAIPTVVPDLGSQAGGFPTDTHRWQDIRAALFVSVGFCDLSVTKEPSTIRGFFVRLPSRLEPYHIPRINYPM